MNNSKCLKTQLLYGVKKLLEFPYPQVCKHLVAADLLSILVEHGTIIPNELAEAVVKADDETAIDLINEMIGLQHEETIDEYYDRKWREEMNENKMEE